MTEVRPTLGASDNNQVFWGMDYGEMPEGFVGVAAGTFVFKVNVTTLDAGNLKANEIHLCRVDAACANPLSIGSLTGLSENLSTGVHTFNVTIASPVLVSGTQRIVALMSGLNESIMSAHFVGITPDQTDTIPLTAVSSARPKGGRFIADIPLSHMG